MTSDENNEDRKFIELDQFIIDEKSIKLLNYKFCLHNYVVILNVVDLQSREPIIVGMIDPEEKQLIRQIEEILERQVTPVQLNAYEIEKALAIGHSEYESPKEFKLSLQPIQKVNFDPDCSPIQLVNELFSRAITLGASDIHIECFEDDVDVRFRIDGILHQITSPISSRRVASVISRLKVLSDLDLSEKRVAQDGRIYATFKDQNLVRAIDFRLSILPGPFGEDAVLRILDSAKPLIGLEELGLSEHSLEQFSMLVNNPEGMVLVTGPTGSGKTTTLYSVLNEINSDEDKILTAEDPIEYLFPKINQKQVGPTMSFADYARAFLRQDPDIIMIGEIRDEETASIALRSAQTGHLVLSTLHTNDSVGSISRLKVLGLDSRLLSEVLLGVISQRLLRKICNSCKVEAVVDDFADDIFKRIGYSFPIFDGKGCRECRNTGLRGRLGIYELFIVDENIIEMISSEAPDHDIRQLARKEGMKSLFDEALNKVKYGITTFSELRRTVPYRIINEPIINTINRNMNQPE